MSTMSVNACLFALFVTAVSAVIKHTYPEFAPYVKVASAIAFFTLGASIIMPLITYLKSLFDGSKIGDYGETVIKALGIALLAEVCSQICKDCGEPSLAQGAEFVCKIEILLMCIPLLEKILSAVKEVMSW